MNGRIEEEYFPQSEAQNCLAEAMPAAQAARGEVIPEGEGHIQITIRDAVFCKATDAFAGMMTTRILRFPTTKAAESWLDREGAQMHELEQEVIITNRLRAKFLERIQHVYRIIYGEEPPHQWEETLKNFREQGLLAYQADRQLGSSRISGYCAAIEAAHTAYNQKVAEEESDVPF